MPTINAIVQPAGPLFTVAISLSMPRSQALLAANQPIPQPVTGTFLIDTGASCTCVDDDFIKPLNLQSTGRIAISTPSTGGTHHHCDQYDVALFIPGNQNQTGGFFLPAMPIVSTHLRSQGIEGLIGRDILKDCTLIYNGTGNLVSLCY